MKLPPLRLGEFVHKKKRQPKTLEGSGRGRLYGRLSGSYSICPKSRLEIGEDCKGKSATFKLVNSRVFIRDGCRLGPIDILAVDSEIRIGNGIRIAGQISLHSPEPSKISIGDDCLFAGGVLIVTSDTHSILDRSTGKRINHARPITIGRHVWIGSAALILKGSSIGDSAIIGARSTVAGKIPANVTAAGVPARVIREGVTWDFNLVA